MKSNVSKLSLVLLTTILLIISLMPTIGRTEQNVEVYIMGINVSQLKHISWKQAALGAVTSFVVHEAGHIIAGNMTGNRTELRSENGWPVPTLYHQPGDNSSVFLFSTGGWAAQIILGSILTAAPATRHSDFTIGFNGFSTLDSALYTIGLHNPLVSGGGDTSMLDRAGYNGNLYSGLTTAVTGSLLYINLKGYPNGQQ